MRASDDSHFDARSPVGRYWLANGLDFTVCDGDGRRIGVVVHVVVDRRRQSADRLIVRRRGLVRRPRYVALDPGSVGLVLPDTQLFVVPAVGKVRPVAASRKPAAARVRGAAASGRGAVAAAGRVSLPVVLAFDRRLAGAAETTRRQARRAVGSGADAAARTGVAVRREAPRLDAWLAARAHENSVVTRTELRRLGVAVGGFVRFVGDLAVLAAVGAAAAVRRAQAALAERRAASLGSTPDPTSETTRETAAQAPPRLPDPQPPEWRRDADAPLARERRHARPARRTRR
jgi:hypothetical protein